MPAQELPARPNLDQYKKRAKELLKAAKAGDARALALIRDHHPRLKHVSDAELHRTTFALADAQLIVARWHGTKNFASCGANSPGRSVRRLLNNQQPDDETASLVADFVFCADTRWETCTLSKSSQRRTPEWLLNPATGSEELLEHHLRFGCGGFTLLPCRAKLLLRSC